LIASQTPYAELAKRLLPEVKGRIKAAIAQNRDAGVPVKGSQRIEYPCLIYSFSVVAGEEVESGPEYRGWRGDFVDLEYQSLLFGSFFENADLLREHRPPVDVSKVRSVAVLRPGEVVETRAYQGSTGSVEISSHKLIATVLDFQTMAPIASRIFNPERLPSVFEFGTTAGGLYYDSVERDYGRLEKEARAWLDSLPQS
jgi:hypothetical protein